MKIRHILFCATALFSAFLYSANGNVISMTPDGDHRPSAKITEFRPGELWKDTDGVAINAHGGGIMFHGGKYWWYGEYKTEGEAGNLAQVGVSCYSSDDLYNWKNEGIALAVSDEPGSDIERGCILERPKVIYNALTGKFVMWFHLELKGSGYSSARSGIAVADRPEGPFSFVRSTRAVPGKWPFNKDEFPDEKGFLARDFESGQMSRDMTLFVDDDGKAYQLSASEDNWTLHIAELTDDYLDYTGKYVRVFSDRLMEAPAIFKKDGTYYFMGSGCTGWAPNAARSASAPSIWGPWTELGNPCEGEGSQLTFNSQSTFILPVAGKENTFIYMGDRWNPKNAIDGRYVWLPIEFDGDRFKIYWRDSWGF